MGGIRGKTGSIVFPNEYNLAARIRWVEDYYIEENCSIISVYLDLKAQSYTYQGKWWPSGRTLAEPGQILVGNEAVTEISSLSGTGHYANVNATDVWTEVTNANDAPPWSSGKIYHKDDGTGSTTISTTYFLAYRDGDNNKQLFGTISAQTIELTTIPRASSITSAANVTLGKACSVKWTPLSSGFRYKLKFSMGSWSKTTDYVQPKTTSAYTYTGYTIPLEAAEQIPKAASGTMKVTLETYNGDTLVGSDDTTFTVTVPENFSTKPTVTDLVLTPVDSPFDGVFVQGNSKVQAAFSSSGKYGASVASAKMAVEGKNYTGEYLSNYLSGYGDIKVTVTVTDTRGFTGTAEGTISVCAYSKPQVKVSECVRCNASGVADDGGTYLKIAASRSYSKVDDGTQHNFCQIRYRYAKDGGTYSSWQTILAKDTLTTDAVQTGALLGNLSATSTYIVEVGVIDDVGNTSETAYTLMTEAVFMHKKEGGKGLGLGMYCTEDNRLDVAWNMRVWGDLLVGPDGLTLEAYIKQIVGG